MQYCACRQEKITLFATTESVSQVSKFILNSKVLKWTMTQTFADCNNVQKGRARDNVYQSPGYHQLVLRNSTSSEEGLAKKGVQI